MSRKPRSDSLLANLPEATRDELADLLLDGRSYKAAAKWLHQDRNVKVSSSAIAGFYRHYCTPLRLRRAAEAANALPELSGGLMANWDQASIALVQQRYFELLAAAKPDPKEVAVFAMQIGDINRGKLEREKLRFNRQKAALSARLKRRDQALAARRVNLLEQQHKKATETLGEAALSPSEKERRLREIFGITA